MNLKLSNILGVLIIALTLVNCTNPKSDQALDPRQFYQIKIYSLDTEDQQQVTESYLESAYLPALKKMGIGPVGVFRNRPTETDSAKKIVVLIPFSSLAQFNEVENSLSKDPDYLTKGSAYLNASYDQPPYTRIESILLRAFEDMPVMKTTTLTNPRTERIYELRSYESATEKIFANKVDMFNAGGEIILFDRLKFNAIFYGEVISGPKMPNLMYMTTHADSATRASNWKEFVDSPEWQDISHRDEYQNNISHIDITFLYPTEYSDY